MPEIVSLPKRRVAVRQANASTAELPAVFTKIFPSVLEALTAQGVTQEQMGHVIAVYHTMDADQMELSAGIEIAEGVEVQSPLALLTLPAGEAAKADHHGPYDTLYQTHMALMPYCAEQGRTPSAGPIERYITDPEAEPDSSKWHTEILLPLE